MMEATILQPGPGFQLILERGAGGDGLDLPFEVPLRFAESGRAGGVLVWREDAMGLTGVYGERGSLIWRREAITTLNLAILRPGRGREGAVGLEVGLEGEEEQPAVAADRYGEDAVAWFKTTRSDWERMLGRRVEVVEYG